MKRKFLLYVTLSFFLFTIIGTQTHELGHIVVAQYLGYQTRLNYGSMSSFDAPQEIRYFEILDQHAEAIKHEEDFPDKIEYTRLRRRVNYERFLITLGGPMQTMLTGTIGLGMLFYRSHIKLQSSFSLLDWVLVFLTLFWLREPFNLLMAVASSVLLGTEYFFGDEFRIARYLELPEWSVAIVFALLGLLICVYVIFGIIPKDFRMRFIIGGLLGGSLGYFIWFDFLGPFLFAR